MENYHILEYIGKGSFGEVYRGRRKYTGQIVAIKYIPKIKKDENNLSDLRREIEILHNLNHENIIFLMDNYETEEAICVVTEYAHGDLYQIISEDGKLPEETLKVLAKQLIEALCYLHTNRIIHRDMKPQNILITGNEIIKLCDFGFARHLSAKTTFVTSVKGTPLYMSPELIEEKPYSYSTDLWSLGIILFESATGKPPYFTSNICTLVNLVRKNAIEYPDDLSPDLLSLLKSLLKKDPNERIGWPDLSTHPFITTATPQSLEKSYEVSNNRDRIELFTKLIQNNLLQVNNNNNNNNNGFDEFSTIYMEENTFTEFESVASELSDNYNWKINSEETEDNKEKCLQLLKDDNMFYQNSHHALETNIKSENNEICNCIIITLKNVIEFDSNVVSSVSIICKIMEIILKYYDYCVNNGLVEVEMNCIKTINEILLKSSFHLYSNELKSIFPKQLLFRLISRNLTPNSNQVEGVIIQSIKLLGTVFDIFTTYPFTLQSQIKEIMNLDILSKCIQLLTSNENISSLCIHALALLLHPITIILNERRCFPFSSCCNSALLTDELKSLRSNTNISQQTMKEQQRIKQMINLRVQELFTTFPQSRQVLSNYLLSKPSIHSAVYRILIHLNPNCVILNDEIMNIIMNISKLDKVTQGFDLLYILTLIKSQSMELKYYVEVMELAFKYVSESIEISTIGCLIVNTVIQISSNEENNINVKSPNRTSILQQFKQLIQSSNNIVEVIFKHLQFGSLASIMESKSHSLLPYRFIGNEYGLCSIGILDSFVKLLDNILEVEPNYINIIFQKSEYFNELHNLLMGSPFYDLSTIGLISLIKIFNKLLHFNKTLYKDNNFNIMLCFIEIVKEKHINCIIQYPYDGLSNAILLMKTVNKEIMNIIQEPNENQIQSVLFNNNLLISYVVNINTFLKYGLSMVLLTDIIHSVYLLLQKDKCFVNQFIESGGLLPIKNYKIFNEDNIDDLIISYLLIISFICKTDGKYYNVLSSMNILNELLPLFDNRNALVKSNLCYCFGNLFRHDKTFIIPSAKQYTNSKTNKSEICLNRLVELCRDNDDNTRKYACFAIGNAAFISSEVYTSLKNGIDIIISLLDDRNEKVKANAIGTLGNLVRNSDELCKIIDEKRGIKKLISICLNNHSDAIVDLSLFSLGNICSYDEMKVIVKRDYPQFIDWLTRMYKSKYTNNISRIKKKLDL